MINRLLILPKLGIQYELKLISFFKRCTLRFESVFGKPFEDDEKCILFHLKCSFCSQGI